MKKHLKIPHIKSVLILADFIDKNAWTFRVTGRKSEIRANDKEININCNLSENNFLIELIHEVGHIIVVNQQDYLSRYEFGYPCQDESILRKKIHKLAVLDEEQNAWAEGEKFARMHGIFDFHGKEFERAFNVHKSKCLMGYVRWVNSKQL